MKKSIVVLLSLMLLSQSTFAYPDEWDKTLCPQLSSDYMQLYYKNDICVKNNNDCIDYNQGWQKLYHKMLSK